MLSIQQLTKTTGVSSRMLRYYDEKGLLKPLSRSSSGIRYYDDTAPGMVNLISTLLFLDYSVEDIAAMLQQEAFSPETAKAFLEKQIHELKIRKEKIETWLSLLHRIQETPASEYHSWEDIAKLTHRYLYEDHMISTHKTADARYKDNFWRENGSDIDAWMTFMFAPVTFPTSPIKMAEINASVLDYWRHNSHRLPAGELDLYYDPSVRVGTETLSRPDIETHWIDHATLHSVPAETYDLIFNDHLFFYRDQLETGIRDMHRLLKPGCHLYVTAEDPGHGETIRKWSHAIEPAKDFRSQWHYNHYHPDLIQSLLGKYFTKVIDHERFNSVKVTDETYFLDHLKKRCHVQENDETAKLRLQKAQKEIHAEFKQHGFIEIESRYHVIEAIK